jgi:hypothetical protein
VDYKIVKANANTGIIDVMYLDTDGNILGVYPIEVPVVEGTYIGGNELETLIQSRAPTWLLTRKTEVATASGFDSIESKVDEKALQELIIANTPPGVLAATVQEVRAANDITKLITILNA